VGFWRTQNHDWMVVVSIEISLLCWITSTIYTKLLCAYCCSFLLFSYTARTCPSTGHLSLDHRLARLGSLALPVLRIWDTWMLFHYSDQFFLSQIYFLLLVLVAWLEFSQSGSPSERSFCELLATSQKKYPLMLASATANFAKMINLVVIFLTAHHSQKVDLTNYLAN